LITGCDCLSSDGPEPFCLALEKLFHMKGNDFTVGLWLNQEHPHVSGGVPPPTVSRGEGVEIVWDGSWFLRDEW
jgi:hypothetical protein